MTALPIIFLPGTLCTGLMFKQQISILSQHCNDVRVVQFTNQESIAQMAKCVIEAANNQPVALIGFSMGGIIAMEVARTHPELIAKLALINSNSHGDLPERKASRPAQIEQAKAGKLASLITDTLMPHYLYQYQPANAELIIQMALSLGEDCFAAQVMAIEDRPDSLGVLQQLDCQTLIIGGLQDKICPAQHQFYMHQALPKSDLLLLGHCGHFSPLEQSDKVTNALCEWYLNNNK